MREAILGFVPVSLILAQLAGNLPDNSPSTQVEQTLQPADFQAAANQSDVGIFGSTPSAGWYSVILGSGAFSSVNLTGTTRFRLRFQLDENDDTGADYARFFSGDAGAVNQPVLVIEYYVP